MYKLKELMICLHYIMALSDTTPDNNVQHQHL